MLVCGLFELFCLVFPKLWEVYTCLWCLGLRTKSIGFGMCFDFVTSEEFVIGGSHAERESFSSPEVLLLG